MAWGRVGELVAILDKWARTSLLALSCFLSSLLIQASVVVFIQSVSLLSVTGDTVCLCLIPAGCTPKISRGPKDGGATRREPNTFGDPLHGILLPAKHQTDIGHLQTRPRGFGLSVCSRQDVIITKSPTSQWSSETNYCYHYFLSFLRYPIDIDGA